MLSLNQRRLNEILDKIVTFTDDPTVEKDISELVEAHQTLEKAWKDVINAFKKNLSASDLTSVEGDMIRVSISPSGTRYVAEDLKIVDPSFLEIKLNPKAIEEYESDKGTLPENVTYNPKRQFACRITMKTGAHD